MILSLMGKDSVCGIESNVPLDSLDCRGPTVLTPSPDCLPSTSYTTLQPKVESVEIVDVTPPDMIYQTPLSGRSTPVSSGRSSPESSKKRKRSRETGIIDQHAAAFQGQQQELIAVVKEMSQTLARVEVHLGAIARELETSNKINAQKP